jgi:hypothetical protein
MISYNIDVINHINNNIFSELKPSKIHGIGLFAIRDINAGTNLVSPWQGESDTYQVPLFMVHSDIQPLLWRYFGISTKSNQTMLKIIENEQNLNIKLFKGMNFAYHPGLFVNHSDFPNVDDQLISIGKINKGDEIVRCYYKKILSSTDKNIL